MTNRPTKIALAALFAVGAAVFGFSAYAALLLPGMVAETQPAAFGLMVALMGLLSFLFAATAIIAAWQARA